MTPTGDTKVCPLCAETIRVAAKVCPHCRHVQTTWTFLNPNLSSALMAILVIGGIIVVGVFLNRLTGSRAFEKYQAHFSVLESSVSQRANSNSTWVVITGVLSNGSSCSWKRIGIEGQLFDGGGKLIDTIPADSDSYGAPVVVAHSVCAFKIESRTSRSLAEYAGHKVFVRWARDGTSWP